jgi:hypothetical protein
MPEKTKKFKTETAEILEDDSLGQKGEAGDA